MAAAASGYQGDGTIGGLEAADGYVFCEASGIVPYINSTSISNHEHDELRRSKTSPWPTTDFATVCGSPAMASL